ncbi:hypothetical protein C4J81_04435 [Deltaproteobacteria bacterium Smac51]|nr:hypothetical protein C4J81_04435 [Deltaproteobacteria bacterium Smac51]
MTEFLANCLSFPVAVFTGMLIIALLYWVVAAFGIVDIDTLDLDADLDVDVDMDLDVGGDASDGLDVSAAKGGAEGLASLLFSLGLYGVPMTLILTFIALFGWFIAYYAFHFGLGVFFEPGLMRTLLGVGLLGLALAGAVILTSLAIRPLRPLFKKHEQTTGASLRGGLAVIRSTEVTENYGEAIYEDGGAGMLIDVRPANRNDTFKRGDRVVILSFDEVTRIYTIISEDEFKGH